MVRYRTASPTGDFGKTVRASAWRSASIYAEHLARVRSAEAELRLKEAELRRVINGARDQERREAAATLAEAEAVLENARVRNGVGDGTC